MTEAPRADTPAEGEVPPKSQVEIVLSPQTVAKGLGILAGIVLVVAAQDALLAIALSIVLVLGLDPPVSALERRGWGRGKAALLLFGLITLGCVILVVWVATPLWNELTDFVAQLPAYIDEIQNSAVFQDIDDNTEALEKLEGLAADAAREISQNAANLLGTAAGLLASVFSLVTLGFLTLFGLIAKPQLTRSALDLMRPEVAARVDRTLNEVSRTISFALLGNIVISVIAGTVVGVAAWIVGAPFPIVLAVIVGIFDLIPQVGSAIAAFIVCVVTLVASGLGPALVLLLVILVYQQVENYMIQPAVMREAVELSGFATIAVVMLGSALLGVVGAILAVPVAASVKVVLRELTEGRRQRMAALRA